TWSVAQRALGERKKDVFEVARPELHVAQRDGLRFQLGERGTERIVRPELFAPQRRAFGLPSGRRRGVRRHPHAHAALAAEYLVETARGNQAALVDDRDPVTD